MGEAGSQAYLYTAQRRAYSSPLGDDLRHVTLPAPAQLLHPEIRRTRLSGLCLQHCVILRPAGFMQCVNIIKCGRRHVYTKLWFLIKAKTVGSLNENFWLHM